MMEVFQTESFYIFVKRERSLWWNRKTSEFTLKAGWDLSSVDDIECIGITQGIIGVVSLPGVYDPHLLIVRESVPVGVLYPPHLVYKVKSICSLSDDEPIGMLPPCSRHNINRTHNTNSPPGKSRLFESSALVNKTWGAVKSAGNTIKNTTQQAAALASNQVKSTVGIKDPTRVEKRITDELHKIFDDSDSFYYCPDGDITNNLQRRYSSDTDDRFFWNKHILKDISKIEAQQWTVQLIQGFVQVEQCVIGNECFTLALVSRRSRHRAGTRYKRRGIDDDGHVANYVETEQILTFRHHQMSFTQIRGSVPVYWSQPGYKYRPPPRIDRDEAETQIAFEKHFNRELDIYQSICIINLVEQTGKEKIIGDAYANHLIKYNSEKLIYVTFDFHDYCRGMRFENVSALIEALAPEAGAMGFHWRDQKGSICNQKSIFRVNCMDCLDRTNVVQTAIGKAVLESQIVKLGLAPPYSAIPEELKAPFMILWANNGDVISRQYAGTNALKGDYTRTGERKLTGIMKDGMNSANRFLIQNFADSFRQIVIDLLQGITVDKTTLSNDDVSDTVLGIIETNLSLDEGPSINQNKFFQMNVLSPEILLIEELIFSSRYYLARFKDSYRQATIDLMLGNSVSSDSLNALGGQTNVEESDALEGAEHARLLVEDCRRILLGNSQYPVGAWGLIDADPNTGDPNETEVDSILLLTDESYIVAEYDSHLDKIVRYECVPLKNITMIEFGLIPSSSTKLSSQLCIRFNYIVDGTDGYFHMFRSPNIRFFNNVAVVIKTQDEIMESLGAIIEFFRISLENCGKMDVSFISGGTLQRRKSKTPYLDVPRGMTRNLSESQLLQIGSKALSNVAGQFSKLGLKLSKSSKKSSGYKPSDPYDPTDVQMGRDVARSGTGSSSESDDNDDSNIFEPDGTDLVQENPLYVENAFLPSVGIVMGSNDPTPVGQLESKEQVVAKISADVNTMSITTVADHIVMPLGMLENASPVRARSPQPLIQIDGKPESDDDLILMGKSSMQTASSSGRNSPVPRDLHLNLSGSQSDNTLRQLKTLTSPLSKFAKGVQNIGMNLDPRKKNVGIKDVTSPQSEDMHTPSMVESQKLIEKWDSIRAKLMRIHGVRRRRDNFDYDLN